MSRTRRLSLRARMLVMLVGVTTILLLIMGTVSTYLFVRRVDGQVQLANKVLIEHADNLATDPGNLAAADSLPSGDALAEIRLTGQLTARPLSQTGLGTRLAAALNQQLAAGGMALAQRDAAVGRTRAAAESIRTAGCRSFPYLRCAFTVDRDIRVASALTMDPRATAAAAGTPAVLLVGQSVSPVRSQVRGFIIAELITGTALIALLALGGEWLIGRGLIPLDEMTRTANEITSQGDLTARMPDADDQTEVGRLGSSINTMLDRIQQAFSSRLRSEQKVREFAADASHELRTPLTTIRGYAELYRQGALGPDQLPNAMRRIEQEAERMSTLVAELLELARLDRTSSLDLTETDLASVVRDAVADAVAVEPQRPVRAEAPPRLVAVVDEPRIRQVLANLLGNVRAHTPVSTPVAVRLGAISGGVLIEVADAGPGMSAQDAIRAFDRFHRAADRGAGEAAGAAGAAGEDQDKDGNEAQRAGAPVSPVMAGELNGPAVRTGSGRSERERTSGSGLGLSIVQAIANAHGGRATLESFPGQGTKVRVWLPVRIVP